MKELLSGNEAIARGAWEAGLHFAAAYPGASAPVVLPLKPVIQPGSTSPMPATCMTMPPVDDRRTLFRRPSISTAGLVPSAASAAMLYLPAGRPSLAGSIVKCCAPAACGGNSIRVCVPVAPELHAAGDFLAVQLHLAGLDRDLGADLAAHRQHLQALQHGGAGGGGLGHVFQRFGLRQLRELVDERGRIRWRQRILVADLRDQQLGKHVLVGADGAGRRGDGVAVRVAVRVAIQAEGIRRGGDHDQLSPMRISDCCIDLMRPMTSTLVSKAREAAIMSAISATSLTLA